MKCLFIFVNIVFRSYRLTITKMSKMINYGAFKVPKDFYFHFLSYAHEIICTLKLLLCATRYKIFYLGTLLLVVSRGNLQLNT